MSNMNGDQFPLKTAFALYLKRWYDTLYADTKSVQEYIQRGFAHGCQWVPARMVDSAESMLAAYQKNDNAPQGRNTLLPVVLVGMAKDYIPMGADWGGRQLGRRLVQIEEGGSVYGYRQAMGEKRAQVVIIAADEATANSLAAQFSLYVGEIPNRRFAAVHEFGQYKPEMPVLIETPDIMFVNVATNQNNITILAADLNLKFQIPYFDAPKPGEPNDGTTNNPPGYPVVESVQVFNEITLQGSIVDSDGITRP